jgi:hypothetical protein
MNSFLAFPWLSTASPDSNRKRPPVSTTTASVGLCASTWTRTPLRMNTANPTTQTITSVSAYDPRRRRIRRISRTGYCSLPSRRNTVSRTPVNATNPATSAAPIAIAHKRQSANPVPAIGVGS